MQKLRRVQNRDDFNLVSRERLFVQFVILLFMASLFFLGEGIWENNKISRVTDNMKTSEATVLEKTKGKDGLRARLLIPGSSFTHIIEVNADEFQAFAVGSKVPIRQNKEIPGNFILDNAEEIRSMAFVKSAALFGAFLVGMKLTARFARTSNDATYADSWKNR
jgi:hypothetical protein